MIAQSSFNFSDTPTKFNGWADWTTWNVVLWINNDQCFYSIAQECETYNEFLYEIEDRDILEEIDFEKSMTEIYMEEILGSDS